MREINWLLDEQFDFGNLWHRTELLNCADFTYGHFRIGNGYATIGGGRIGDKLYYSVTFCSPKDNFSKKTGREHVANHLGYSTFGHLRGVFTLNDELKDEQPAIVLQRAVEHHLSKMRNRKPQWAKDVSVRFRGKRRVGEVTDWLSQ
jgi:hypothetical protein